ncbi:ornithine cyclodeaminase family protein [Bosea sp. 2RAB26]|uniref:ornithine cyclodeaminase family protein n=1 Tax=Bosea sp. 2RAB26 TaxID=3237476 RepID=UPI003F90799B
MTMSSPTIIGAPETASALAYRPLIDALATGFAAGCQAPLRHHHAIDQAGQPQATLLLMPAWSHDGDADSLLGVKIVTVYPGNAAKGLPGLASTYVLYDGSTGQQLAIIDGNTITARRTVATAALGARFLSRENARSLLLLGSGRVASLVPGAMRAVRPIDKVAVWDIDGVGARRLADNLTANGFQATVVDNLEHAVGEADIISAATLSTHPLLRGDWVRPGTHVDLIGSFTPTMREADDRLMAAAMIYVDTSDALHESGDLIQPIDAGVITASDVRATLTELCRGSAFGRQSAEQTTVFKAVGSSLADLVAARLVYRTLKAPEQQMRLNTAS